jgi:hypothetical protein
MPPCGSIYCLEPNVAAVGASIGDPARAAMLAALFDGRALPAAELAFRARVSPQSASALRDCRSAARGFAQSTAMERLREARSCHDHLAGRLGVAVTDALIEDRVIRKTADAFGGALRAIASTGPKGGRIWPEAWAPRKRIISRYRSAQRRR